MTGQELKRIADGCGAVETIERIGGDVMVEIPVDRELASLPITELNLGVRSFNALMRAKIETVGALAGAIMYDCGIEKIRNLGRTSAHEIKTVLLAECYRRLSDGMKLDFWNRVAEVNGL